MEKQIFSEGDKVFIYGFGWVTIEKVEKFYVVIRKVYLGKDIFFYVLNELVSFTEYTLQGNSQEKPVNYEEYIGKLGKFWDEGEKNFVVGKLLKYEDKLFYVKDYSYYEHFELLTEEQIKVLGLE